MLLRFCRRRGWDAVSLADLRVVDRNGTLGGERVSIDTQAWPHARHDSPNDRLDLRSGIIRAHAENAGLRVVESDTGYETCLRSARRAGMHNHVRCGTLLQQLADGSDESESTQ